MKRDRDEGSVLLLTMGFVSIGLALMVVVIDVSSVFLARRSLVSACDGAALAGAQALDADRLYRQGAHGTIPVGPGEVDRAVRDFVTSTYPDADFPGQRFENTTDGATVRVTGSRQVVLPFARYLRVLGINDVTVAASSSAQGQQR